MLRTPLESLTVHATQGDFVLKRWMKVDVIDPETNDVTGSGSIFRFYGGEPECTNDEVRVVVKVESGERPEMWYVEPRAIRVRSSES